MTTRILVGDCREQLQTLDAESVHCVVTSPPFFGLRNYGVDGQIGLEPTIDEHVTALVDVSREVRRVLRQDGTCFMEYGDAYQDKQLIGAPWRVAFALQEDGWWIRSSIIWARPNPMPESVTDRPTKSYSNVFLLTRSGKYFYDADAVREKSGNEASWEEYEKAAKDGRASPAGSSARRKDADKLGVAFGDKPQAVTHPSGRNLRDVWTIPTHAFPGAHFATFPPKLVQPCIKAGTSEKGCCAECGAPIRRVVEATGGTIGQAWHDHEADAVHGQLKNADGMDTYQRETKGWKASCDCDAGEPVPCTVLDPFGGAGTTALVADRLQRDSILIELNPDYAEMARKRIAGDCPMFADVNIEDEP